VIAQDDFTKNGPLGPTWRTWTGAFSVSGGAAQSTAARAYATMGTTTVADMSVSAVVTPGSLDYSGVLARASGDRNHYVGWINHDGSVHIARRNDWVYTYLADATPPISGPHKLTLKVAGQGPVHLTLYVDDNPVIDTVDSAPGAILGAGTAGIFAWQGAGAAFQHFLATQP
jgi:hypothetical protein